MMIRSSRIFALIVLWLCVLACSAEAVPNPQSGKEIDRAAWTPSIEVIKINDHLLAFYDGRDIAEDPPFAPTYDNWVYWGAMSLGMCSYAVYQGETAIVYDTMAVPEQARWIRNYLADLGVKRFIVVLSHWHTDHIGGLEVYADSDIIACDLSRKLMLENKDALEQGTFWGPPAINPVFMPDITFADRLNIYVGDIAVELHHYDIHSPDGNLIYLPADKILLSGDTLEDTVTFISDPGDIPTHLKELKRLRSLGFERIYPNHGDPDVIKNSGYNTGFIDSTVSYITRLVQHAHDKNFMDSNLKDFIKDDLAKGWVHYFPAYDDVHKHNLEEVQKYYQGKPLPKL